MSESLDAKFAKLEEFRRGRAWATNAMLCLLGTGLLLLTRQFVSENGHFTIGFSGCSGWSAWLYIAAVIVVFTQPVDRATFWIVIGFAVAFRAMTLFADPFLSSDIYRYVWDGVVQHAHISPYRYVPADPALSFLRPPDSAMQNDIFDNINRKEYAHTIYPPVAQMIYWLATYFSPTVTAMKAAMVGFECVTAAALLALLRRMGRPREQVLLYVWCPLLVWEIAGSGHVDAAVFAFVTLALLFRYRGQPVLTGLFLGLAVMTKFYPLVLLPALWTRDESGTGLRRLGDWRMPATVAAVCAHGICAVSFGGAACGAGISLSGYSKEEGIDTGARFFLFDFARSLPGMGALPLAVYMVFCAVVLGGIALWAWKVAAVERFGVGGGMGGAPKFVRAAMLLGFAMMLLFSPHYPWYVVWLIPFFALLPNLPLLTYLMGFFYMFTTALAEWNSAKDVCAEQDSVWSGSSFGGGASAAAAMAAAKGAAGLNAGTANAEVAKDAEIRGGAGVQVSVIVAALNEAESIGHVVAAMPLGRRRWLSSDGVPGSRQRQQRRHSRDRRRGRRGRCAFAARLWQRHVGRHAGCCGRGAGFC